MHNAVFFFLVYSSAQKTEAVRSSEMSVNFTELHGEKSTFQSHRCDDLKSNAVIPYERYRQHFNSQPNIPCFEPPQQLSLNNVTILFFLHVLIHFYQFVHFFLEFS
jgi:hypothetical protein